MALCLSHLRASAFSVAMGRCFNPLQNTPLPTETLWDSPPTLSSGSATRIFLDWRAYQKQWQSTAQKLQHWNQKIFFFSGKLASTTSLSDSTLQQTLPFPTWLKSNSPTKMDPCAILSFEFRDGERGYLSCLYASTLPSMTCLVPRLWSPRHSFEA